MTTKQRYVLAAGLLLALFAGGYATGRWAAPDHVVYKDKIVTVDKEKLVSVVDTDKILNALKNVNTQKDVHTVRVVEKEPDGTTKVTVTQDDKSKTESETKVQQKEQETKTVVQEKLVYQDRETTKLVERSKPSWSFSLQPGFDFAGALGHSSSYSLLPTLPVAHLVLGASVEHRFLGPLFLGVWGNSSGMGGLSLRLEF